jgi:hypothetical protein
MDILRSIPSWSSRVAAAHTIPREEASVDSYIRPMTEVVQALRRELPAYTVNTEVKTKWMTRWGKKA